MFIIVKVLLLVGLVKLLLVWDKPLWCAGIYGSFVMLLAWGVGYSFGAGLLVGHIAFGLGALYFWLLHRLEGAGSLWWLVLVGGIAIGIV